MKKLWEIDPELIDQAVRQVCASHETQPMDAPAITIQHLSDSRELVEWAQMATHASRVAKQHRPDLTEAQAELSARHDLPDHRHRNRS